MKIFVTFAALLFSTMAAHAQSITKYAASGKPVRLDFVYSTNPDCTASGDPTVRITREPDNGRVTAAVNRHFPSFAQSNVRSVCNTRRVSGRYVQYVSRRSFVGTDYVSAEYIFPSGAMTRRNFTIEVR
jgi:hypothetical protein